MPTNRTRCPLATVSVGLALLWSPPAAASQALPAFDLIEVSNGFGPLLPHRIEMLDGGGNPTGQVIEIRVLQDLLENHTDDNPVLPPAAWPVGAELPGGAAGNHYLLARFTGDLDLDSILDPSPAGLANSGLIGTITVVAFDPLTGAVTPVQGRAFVAGQTYAGTPSGNPPKLERQSWVRRVGGLPQATDVDNDGDGQPDGLGFPATEPSTSFPGAEFLVARNAFVFVPDSDGRLDTHETFPSGLQIRLQMRPGVRTLSGQELGDTFKADSTVAGDSFSPEVQFTPPPSSQPLIEPGNGDADVDPQTTVRIGFTEAVQPLSVGPLPTSPGFPGSAVRLEFGPPSARVNMPFTVLPRNVYDFSTFDLTPAFAFPGAGPDPGACGGFNQIDVTVEAGQLSDLAAPGNTNQLGVASFFVTGEGPGLVNAPVTPDAIYAGTRGPVPGLSVVDLNGFGASTGNPNFDPSFQNPQEGDSNYANNPNVRFQGPSLDPPLAPGVCTFDGGSAGVFTRTLDSNLDPALARAPVIGRIQDMMLGAALDPVFNNAPAPFGCQAGGGDVCAVSGLKLVNPIPGGPNTVVPAAPGQPGVVPGAPNPVSWAPHPNPPPLAFPPLCASPLILGLEPTSIDSLTTGTVNLLVPGDPFGDPAGGIPPSGLFTPEQNSFFVGPAGATALPECTEYQLRQQVGQFLYALDRQRAEVVVLNSNRMTVIDRIEMSDPVALAVGPNLDFLAVSNRTTADVRFVDIDSASSTFHQVVKTTAVGSQPWGLAWDPGNEDILVCNEGEDTISIVSAFSLEVRKTVGAYLDRPFDIAITPRQAGFGFQRNVYFAYALNRRGSVAVFESGPDGVNGWGFDDVLGLAPFRFLRPKAIQADPLELGSGVWVAHEGPFDPATGLPGATGEGALSNLVIDSAVVGQIALVPGQQPEFRAMELAIRTSVGEQELSGIPVDIAFDNLRNLGALPGVGTSFGAGTPLPVNGKGLVRAHGGGFENTNEASLVFAAVPRQASGAAGVIDVLSLAAGAQRIDTNAFQPGAQSVPAPGVVVLMDYFRQ